MQKKKKKILFSSAFFIHNNDLSVDGNIVHEDEREQFGNKL